jgi:tetratricopeptide (TPR) repeat protein
MSSDSDLVRRNAHTSRSGNGGWRGFGPAVLFGAHLRHLRFISRLSAFICVHLRPTFYLRHLRFICGLAVSICVHLRLFYLRRLRPTFHLRHLRFICCLSVSICGLVSAVHAQHAAPAVPVVPLDLLERPVTLRTGIGAVRHPVSTTSADAQRFYEQGLAYLHSYVWIEAARSFNQALRLDPSLAVAQAELSVAYTELARMNEAKAAIDRAQASLPKLPEHDRRHVELRALQFEAERNPQDKAKLAAYRQALDAAVAASPQDAELLLLRGIAESPDPADRGQGAVPSSIPYFEKAAAAAPKHVAAAHYLTHAYENAGRIEEALEAGAEYAKAAPEIPHARHMHGHNLRRAGRTLEAVAEFETADRLHREYFERESISPTLDWHYHHNLDLLASSRRYLGQMQQAASLYKRAFDLPSFLVAQVYNKRQWTAFLRSRGRLEEAHAAAQQLVNHPHPLIQATGHIETGYALIAAGRWADAGNAYNTALRMLRGGVEGGTMAAPALLALQGEIALRTADREKGRRTLLEAAKRWRALPGPDGWVQALFALEEMTMAARQVGDWQLAESLAKEMLEHDAEYAGTHYALGLVAEHAGNEDDARSAFALAQKYWSHADRNLPELTEIRKRLK